MFSGIQAASDAANPIDSSDPIACSTLCKVDYSAEVTLTNPGGGEVTITCDGSPGICWCNESVLPCAQLDPCAVSMVYSFNDHVSWHTWVPHVVEQVGGGAPHTQPVCAAPGSGSNKPPDHEETVDECGGSTQHTIQYWKKRLAPTDVEDINPDKVVFISCSICDTATNCN